MLRSIALIPLLSLLLPFSLRAQSEGDSLITDLLLLLPREDAWPPAPRQVYPASFFRDILLHPGLGNFLDNSVHAVVFQTETAGDIGLADPLVFSLQGSSWLWNRYYLDGLRNDDPWQTGHLLYQPPMQHTSLGLDPNGPALHFSTEALQRPWASVTYNHGDLGGISGFTQPMVEWFHRTATDRLKRPLPGRRHLVYATEVQFGTPLVGQGHQLSGQFLLGRRRMPDISFAGLDAFYPENFGRMMLHYQRPAGRISLGALFNAESRDNYYSEAYYSPRETARFRSATATAYGIVRRAHFLANLALTAGLRDLRHHDPGFSRNILDQDGEGFEPWYPSSTDRFLSLQGALDRSLCGGLRLLAHTQNHLLMFRPLQEEMLNPVFLMNDHSWQSLFAARWTSADFNGGLLENRLGMGWEGQWARGLDISLQSFLSLDGLLLQGNSHLSPGLEARMRLDWEPLP
ncbi:MAG TPA: hypothetical protein P5550_02380, partial [Bacteroidales bacterium]|nr:hypothetical protein [Bacteroidales bacterium]